jgi:hypothetical protein
MKTKEASNFIVLLWYLGMVETVRRGMRMLQVVTPRGVGKRARPMWGLQFKRWFSPPTSHIANEWKSCQIVEKGECDNHSTRIEEPPFFWWDLLTPLVPVSVLPPIQQISRARHQLSHLPTPLLKHVYLNTLRKQNAALFYAVMMDGMAEL